MNIFSSLTPNRFYTVRFTWRIPSDDNNNLCFSVVSDLPDGLLQYARSLYSDLASKFEDPSDIRMGYEYLHEYDPGRIGVFHSFYLDDSDDDDSDADFTSNITIQESEV